MIPVPPAQTIGGSESVVDALTESAAGFVGDVFGIPSVDTVVTIAGNVVIGLAGAALIAFGAVTALGSTRAGRALGGAAVTGASKGAL